MTMHPTAKTCIRWAVVLMVVGAVLLAYGTDLYVGLMGLAGGTAETGLNVVHLVLTLVRSAVFPLGAVLVGAAIVIQTLAGSVVDRRRGQTAPPDTGIGVIEQQHREDRAE